MCSSDFHALGPPELGFEHYSSILVVIVIVLLYSVLATMIFSHIRFLCKNVVFYFLYLFYGLIYVYLLCACQYISPLWCVEDDNSLEELESDRLLKVR